MTIETQFNQPTHRLYAVRGKGKTARWTEIGAAWPNSDGQGFSLQLNAVPLDGHIVMRVPTTKAENGGQQ